MITSDIDTSDWKVYRNEEFGFEFRYPEDWYVYKFAVTADNSVIENISFSPLGNVSDGALIKLQVGRDMEWIDNLGNKLDPGQYLREVNVGMLRAIQIKRKTNHITSTYLIFGEIYYSFYFVPSGVISNEVYNAVLLSFKQTQNQ